MKKITILAVDDEEPNREMLETAFHQDGHFVYTAQSIRDARKALEAGKPDIIILDRGLPDGDGLQLCLTLREDSILKDIPILMLTGKSEVTDKIPGLRYGADDYLVKPFDIDELRARVGAIIRRVYGEMTATLASAGITVDLKARAVTLNKQPVAITSREFALLRVFMENPNTVLSHDSLIAKVWSDTELASTKVVDVTVMNLRRKLGGEGSPICSVRSCGYKFTSAD